MMTRDEMIRRYNALTAAHWYLVGFTFEGKLYALALEELPAQMLGITRTSSRRGNVMKLRLRLGEKLKKALVADGTAALLGDADLVEAEGHNKGEVFEKLMVEALTGKTWHKDSTPFWQAGDLELDGWQVQVKFEEAEVTNERVLEAAALATA